jgi:hypothetical protein
MTNFCTFSSPTRLEYYRGTISKFGVDISYTKGELNDPNCALNAIDRGVLDFTNQCPDIDSADIDCFGAPWRGWERYHDQWLSFGWRGGCSAKRYAAGRDICCLSDNTFSDHGGNYNVRRFLYRGERRQCTISRRSLERRGYEQHRHVRIAEWWEGPRLAAVSAQWGA